MINIKYEELPPPIPLGKAIDLSNKRIGDLIPLYKIQSPNGSDRTYWACKCVCGEYCIRKSTNLLNNAHSFCQSPQHKKNRLIGEKRGKLTIIEVTDEYDDMRGWKYLCRCECGNTCYKWGKYLFYDEQQNCGCSMMKDLTGYRFGKLLVLEATDQRSPGGAVMWKCKCDCGNIINLNCDSLKIRNVISCGCVKESHGEQVIRNILDINQINYNYDKCQLDCRFPDTNRCARFDFELIDRKEFIEYDGEQHFVVGNGWNDVNHFVKTRNRDLYKNQWALDNNITIKRIPYTEKDMLSLERIMSDEFIITPKTHPEWYPPKDKKFPYYSIEDFDNDRAI